MTQKGQFAKILFGFALLLILVNVLLLQCRSGYDGSFLVIGGQKSGTSSLGQYFAAHPQLCLKHKTEQALLLVNHIKGFEPIDKTMEQCFADARDIEYALEPVVDQTATLFTCPCCPTIWSSKFPDFKLIVLLRHPIERALSRFAEQWHWKLKTAPDISSTEFRDSFNSSFNSHLAHMKRAQNEQDTLVAAAYSPIFGQSLYPIFLKNWLRTYPATSIKVVFTETLSSRPEVTMAELESFLGLSHHNYDPALLHSKFNPSDCKDKKPEWKNSCAVDPDPLRHYHKLDATLRAKLDNYYAPHMSETVRILGQLDDTVSVPDLWIV